MLIQREVEIMSETLATNFAIWTIIKGIRYIVNFRKFRHDYNTYRGQSSKQTFDVCDFHFSLPVFLFTIVFPFFLRDTNSF